MTMLLRSMWAAFSGFTLLPLPARAWKEKELRCALAMLPLAGLLTGCGSWLCLTASQRWSGELLRVMALAALSHLAGGAACIDGYIRTCRAFFRKKSDRARAEGALYYFVLLALLSQVRGGRAGLLYCAGLWLSRILMGFSALSLRCAEQGEGLYPAMVRACAKKGSRVLLLLQFCLCGAVMLLTQVEAAFFVLVLNLAWLYLYCRLCVKRSGGVTADSQGFFLCVSELLTAATALACLQWI